MNYYGGNNPYNNGYNPYGQFFGFGQKTPVEINNTKNLKSIYSVAGLGILLFFATAYATQLIAAILSLFINKNILENGWFEVFLTDVPIYGVALWVLLFFMSKLEAQKPQKRKFGVGNSLAVFPVACFMMLVGSIIGNYADQILQSFFNVTIDDTLAETASKMSLPLQILFFAIIAPFGEELVFRKLLLDRTSRFGEGASIMFSAVTFALFHGNVKQLFYAFGVGLLLGYLYVKTGSYIKCVLLHAGINMFFGIIVPEIAVFLESSDFTMMCLALGTVLFEFLLAIAGLVLFIVFIACGKVTLEKSKYSLSNSSYKNAFVNAPFIVYASAILFLILICYLPS